MISRHSHVTFCLCGLLAWSAGCSDGDGAGAPRQEAQVGGVAADQPVKGTLEFTIVKDVGEFAGKTPASPFDKIEKADIPFEQQTANLPKQLVQIIPSLLQSNSLVDSSIIPQEFKQNERFLLDYSGAGVYLRESGKEKPLVDFYCDAPENAYSLASRIVSTRGYCRWGTFSPNNSFVAVGTDSSTIYIYSIENHALVQEIANAHFPVSFSEDETLFRCFGNDSFLMTYQLEEKKFKGISRTQVIPESLGPDPHHFPNTVAFGPDYLVTTKVGPPHNPADLSGDSWVGLALFRLDRDGATLVRSTNFNAEMMPRIVARGTRFAVIGHGFDENYALTGNWIFYGESTTGKLMFVEIPMEMFHQQKLIDLDSSGRYAFVQGFVENGDLFVLRLQGRD